MGCWGIKAFESDDGLDVKFLLREHLPEDGRLELKTVIDILQKDERCAPPKVTEGRSHTSPMALAELMGMFLDQDTTKLDLSVEESSEEKRFGDIRSFTADRESIRWIKDYLAETLKYSRESAAHGIENGGWFQQRDWKAWQRHMEGLISRMDDLLAMPEETVELANPSARQEQKMC